MKKLLAALVVLLLISGCAVNNNVWYQANASQEVFAQDRYACLQQAQQPNSTAYYGDYGGLLAGKQYTAQAGMVTNNPLFTACMNARGWSWVNRDALAVNNGSPSTPSVNSAVKEDQQRSIAKGVEICTRPEYEPLFEKCPCDPRKITFAQMADRTKITDGQKALFLKFATEADAATDAGTESIRKMGGPRNQKLVEIRQWSNQQNLKVRLDLVDRKITWGEYATRRKQIFDETDKKNRGG